METLDKEILEYLREKEASLLNELKKIQSAIAIYTNKSSFKKVTYPKNGSWSEKIYCILTVNNNLLVKEICEIILTYENSLDKKTLFNTISQYCSNMGIKKILNRTKENKKYRYSIKDKNN